MLLVAVDGASPGVGKSTLCNGLAASLADAGHRVDHFREEEILTRPEFTDVATQFTTTKTVRPATFIQAVTDLLGNADANGTEIVVADALLPFIPSLLVWGYEESAINEFLTELSAAVVQTRIAFVYLDGIVDTSLARAEAREEPGWLDWLVDKLGQFDRAATVDYLAAQRDLTLRLVAAQPWDLVVLDNADQRLTANLLAEAMARLER